MIDREGRNIEYLRLSVTERCTLKCVYCRAGEGLCPKMRELSAAEFARIVRAMADLGVRKIRLTGGEPLLRRDLEDILSRIRAIPGIAEIAMTTNAQQLPGRADALKRAGLTRLNISFDSLRPERYRSITGGGELARVLSGIDEAIAAGLLPLKINFVPMRGVNDDEIDDVMLLARDRPLDVRFIELMPMGGENTEARRIPSDELLRARPWLTPLKPRYASQPSVDYTAEGFLGRVGFISPVSHSFCGECNRVRVMSDGMLRPCLGDNMEVSLLDALRAGDDALLHKTIRRAVFHKPRGHSFKDAGFHSEKNMSRIGG